MAWPASHWFTESLRHSHAILIRVDPQREGVRLGPDVIGSRYYTEGLPLAPGGLITTDSASQVRRQLELRLADSRLNPRDPSSPLAPYGTELVVRYGIRYLSATEYVPVGVFRLDEARGSLVGGEVSITAPDRSRAIADAKFLVPRNSSAGLPIPLQIAHLVTEVLPDCEVIDQTHSSAVTPRTVWESERWEAIEDLATSIGAEVIFDPLGRCVIRYVPSAYALPSWWVTMGHEGTINAGETLISRTGVYNGVVARGERTDDAPPVYGTATDDDPGSPTYWDGPFGQVTFLWRSNLLTTRKQAVRAAQGLLARKKMAVRELGLTIAPNPLLEAGDVLAVQYQDYSVDRMVLTKTELRLEPQPMTVRARSGQIVTEDTAEIDVPPDAAIMKVGVLPAARGALSALAEFERIELASEGSFTIRRSDSENFPSWAAHPASADVGIRASFATVRSDPARMARNFDHTMVTAFVAAIPADHPVYLCWQPAAEEPGRHLDPATVRAAGRQFAKLVKAARGTRKVWVTWLFKGFSFAPLSARDPKAWYWGNKAVEVVATDAINPYTNTDRYLSAPNHIGAVQAQRFAHLHGRRFGIAAMASYDLPALHRPAFITSGFAFARGLAQPACEFVIWQHTPGRHGGLWLDTSPESMDAWKAAIS